MRNERTTRPKRLSQNGRIARSANRPMSQLTITTLRFHLSRKTPPIGASTKPGSMRAIITSPIPVPDPETFPAIAMIASRPVQSPRLETNCAPMSGMNPGVRNTRQGVGGIGSLSGEDGMNGAWGSLTRRSA